MAFVLRMVRKRATWQKDAMYADYPWLKPNNIPPDPFVDIAETELSLWYVESETDPNLDYICAALAARRDNISHFEYALFDINAIQAANFILHPTDGIIPVPDNDPIRKLHRDIEKLTAVDALRFLEAIWHNAISKIIYKNEIQQLIIDSVAENRLDPNKMSPSIRNKLNIRT